VIRFKQSVMGLMWAILLPAVIVTAGIIARYRMSAISNKPIVGREIAGITLNGLVWTFSADSLCFSSTSLIGNPNLVTKIFMPREIFPLASILSQLPDFAVASSLAIVVFLGTRLGTRWLLLWVSLLLAMTIALATGWALIISAACLFVRDVKYLVEVVMPFAMFIPPVFYDVEMFMKGWNLRMLNPPGPLMEGMEKSIVYGSESSLTWVAQIGAVALLSLLAGLYFFKKWEPAFAESI
jgi:ABC-type polysaccharide/polyol phosphate export permease